MNRHDRTRGRAHGASLLAALAVLAVVAVPVAQGTAAAAGAPTVVAASVAEDATSASREARQLRRETAALLTGYLTQYGDRFTTAENDELRAYQSEADRQLASVVVTTKRLQSLVAARAPRGQVLVAGRAAQRAHERARRAAEASYEGARRIMEPRLSLFEGIAAIREYDAMLGRFDDLGDRIDSVVAGIDR